MPGLVGRPSLEGQEGSGDPPKGTGVVGKPYLRFGKGQRPSRSTGMGWEALPDSREG